MLKANPNTVHRGDIVHALIEVDRIAFTVVRKSPKTLIIKNKEAGVKKAFWSETKGRYKIEGKYLISI